MQPADVRKIPAFGKVTWKRVTLSESAVDDFRFLSSFSSLVVEVRNEDTNGP